ncbi:uncharacterized protein RJT21DRAFT_85898 [Scheffersomyces amazonensis]|uniref:uncharacterized protein n=1 Tax=Scheffersomyces amazonensis TaxID=1078765 RepID=UPI00315CE4C3
MYLLGAVGLAGVTIAATIYAKSGPKVGQTLPGKLGWVDLKLRQANKVSHNTKHYIFDLKNEDDIAGFEACSFVVAYLKTSQGSFIRPYTPISHPDQKGTIEFLIKSYEKGKFSKNIWNLEEGDVVSFKGPIEAYRWKANQKRHVSLIGGGAGITPLYQLLRTITKNPADHTSVDLFYSCSTPEEILLKKEIDTIAQEHSDQVKVHYFVTHAPENWDGQKGYINKDYLKSNLQPASDDSKIFVCGPPEFFKTICGNKPNPIMQGPFSGILSELGYDRKHVFKF